MNIVDVLFVPTLLILAMWVLCTLIDSVSDKKLIEYFNLEAMESRPLMGVFCGIGLILVVFLAASVIYDVNEINEDLLIVNFAKGVLYYTIFCSWWWLIECYSKGYIRKWFSFMKS